MTNICKISATAHVQQYVCATICLCAVNLCVCAISESCVRAHARTAKREQCLQTRGHQTFFAEGQIAARLTGRTRCELGTEYKYLEFSFTLRTTHMLITASKSTFSRHRFFAVTSLCCSCHQYKVFLVLLFSARFYNYSIVPATDTFSESW